MSRLKSLIPNAPTSLSLNRGFVIALLVGGLSLLGLFIYLMHVSSAQPSTQQTEQDDAFDVNSTQLAIAQVKHAPVRSPAKAETALHYQAILSQTQRKALESPIRVFHHEATSPTTTQPLPSQSVPSSMTTASAATSYQLQNQQAHKHAFLQQQGREQANRIHSRWQPATEWTVQAGTLIPAVLQTQINSDLPGFITAKVRRNVFDTRTGNQLLIPQGTTLIGRYDSQVAYGQERVLIAWSRLLFPDGSSQAIEGQPGVDVSGQSGLADKVNHHFLNVFGASAMVSALGAAGQLSQPRTSGNQLSTSQVLYSAVGTQMTETGSRLVDKTMNIQPTIVIRAGTLFNVVMQKDLALPHPYRGG